MADQPLIAVTGPGHGTPWAWWATRRRLLRSGARPLRLRPDRPAWDDRIDGIVVGGGNDVDPALYGGDLSVARNVDPIRDRFELAVLSLAEEHGLPVLGICRGAQLINVYSGGTLFGDLSAQRRLTSNRATLLPRKPIDVTDGSMLRDWVGRRKLKVNSLHHQAVDRPGQGLQVSAKDRDHIVQAIESTHGPLRLGVQWHPEYLPQKKAQRRLFRRFVSHCRH